MTRYLHCVTTILLFSLCFAQPKITRDKFGNFYQFQEREGKFPTLVYLDCNGGSAADFDTTRAIFDSLGWNVAVCKYAKNHRSAMENDSDVLTLVRGLINNPSVDYKRIVIYGFSGMGAQAIRVALRYPQYFGGVITQCAHHGGIEEPDWTNAAGMPIILISRTEDWNLEHNRNMLGMFEEAGLEAELIVTAGAHGIGDAKELYSACARMSVLMK